MKSFVIICGESREGTYNPSVTFQSDLRKDIIVCLHKGQSVASLSESSEIGEDELLNH